MALSPAQRATLDAAARRIVPHAYDPSRGPLIDVASLVEQRLLTLPDGGHELGLALNVLGSRASALLTLDLPRPFASLSPAAQDRVLTRFSRSRIGLLRTVFQGIRRLVLAVHYFTPEAQKSIGYLGAFHAREPSLPFEGPAEGTPRDDEPILRAPRGEKAKILTLAADSDALRERNPIPKGVKTARDVSGDVFLSADVVVIGSGAGGAVAAARLAEAGHEVVILEEGSFWTAADFTENEAEMTERLYADGGTRATDDLGVSILQGRSVGGGTTVNWLIMLRPGDHVLEEWTQHFGTEAMGPRDLAPIFDQIEREVSATRVPDDAHSANNRLIFAGAKKLGWHAEAAKINAKGCVRAGFCGYGCRYGAKQSALATFLPRALHAGARLFADASATRIEIVERGGRLPKKRVTAVVRDRETGNPKGTITVDAPVVVLAGGAVGTPALLQRSGLGGGGVGHWLRLHPTTAVFGLYDHDVYSGAVGIPLSAMCDEFGASGKNGYGYWIECPPLHPGLAAAAMSGFGEAHRELFARYRTTGTMIALVRDGADRELSNGSVLTDRDGRVRIRYRLGPTDTQHMVQATESTARLHLAAGAREVITLHTDPVRATKESDLAAIQRRPMGSNELGLFSAHVNGTCRMGKERRSSGVNPDGERHGVPGLFVCDGSILPTGLGVNPQETIMALATLIAGRIAARL